MALINFLQAEHSGHPGVGDAAAQGRDMSSLALRPAAVGGNPTNELQEPYFNFNVLDSQDLGSGFTV